MKKLLWVIFIAAIVLVGVYAVYMNNHRPAVSEQSAGDAHTSILGQYVTYASEEWGFNIQRPENVPPKTVGFEGDLSFGATPIVGFSLPSELFSGTNLTEAGVFVGATSSKDAITKCIQASPDAQEQSAGSAVIGGENWEAVTSIGAASGNIYEQKIYRTVHNNICYELVELLHSGNIANYPAGAVKEFDK